MNYLKKIGLFLGVILVTIGCQSDKNSKNKNQNADKKANASVNLKISNAKGKKLVLERLTARNVELIDSISFDDNQYNYSLYVPEPGFYRIKDTDQNFMVFILSPNDHIKITADANNLEGTYTVKGSPETTRLQKLNKSLYKFYARRDSLARAIQQHQSARDINSYINAIEYQKVIIEEYNQMLRDFIRENPGSLASLVAVEKLNPETDFPYYKMVAEALQKTMPQSIYTKNITERVKSMGALAVGAEAPEIALPNPEGKILKLSDLKGKIVLIDFWASWCKPCRRANPEVVRLYNKYHDKGFEVFSVSLDKNKTSWTKAIQQDGLIWPYHVSDLKYWNSSVVKLYNFNGIPYTVLVDREGKILAKNLRGKALEQKLKEIFEK